VHRHWSELTDSVAEGPGPVDAPVVCFVDVRIEPDGTVTSATLAPDQEDCPAAAEAVARSVRLGARDAVVTTSLPVRLQPE
jgi:hypothetical protein